MSSDKWDKVDFAEWKRFWQSEVGQKAFSQMQDFKLLALDEALRAVRNADSTNEEIVRRISRAEGINQILQFIQLNISRANDKGKKKEEVGTSS